MAMFPGLQPMQRVQPEKINQYRKLAVLGRGGFGTCFKVKKGSALFAMKEITENGLFNADVLKEVDILRNLQHDNIVSYIEAFFENGSLYIVMEYCSGGDLDDVLRENSRLDINEVMKWFIQLCRALHYVHSRGIIHRDVKPTNIFLTASRKIKLGDFGIAKILEIRRSGLSPGLTTQSYATGFYPYAATMCGTLNYTAPEVFNGRYDRKVDVWSAGCVLTDLCNNQPWMTQRYYRSRLTMLLNAMLEENPRKRAGMGDILNDPFLELFQQ